MNNHDEQLLRSLSWLMSIGIEADLDDLAIYRGYFHHGMADYDKGVKDVNCPYQTKLAQELWKAGWLYGRHLAHAIY